MKTEFKKILTYTTIIIILFSCKPNHRDDTLIEFKAINEGTQNFSFINFNKDNSFYLETSSFFTTKTINGNWLKINDTIFISFKNEEAYNLSDTNLIFKDYIIPINQIHIADSLHILGRYYKIE